MNRRIRTRMYGGVGGRRPRGAFAYPDLPPSYAKELCRGITQASLDVKWRCILYPYRVDQLLVDAMARAGCVEASVGFESANEQVLRGMNKRFRRKDVAQGCSLLKGYGIRQVASFSLAVLVRPLNRWRKAFLLPIPSIWSPCKLRLVYVFIREHRLRKGRWKKVSLRLVTIFLHPDST